MIARLKDLLLILAVLASMAVATAPGLVAFVLGCLVGALALLGGADWLRAALWPPH